MHEHRNLKRMEESDVGTNKSRNYIPFQCKMIVFQESSLQVCVCVGKILELSI